MTSEQFVAFFYKEKQALLNAYTGDTGGTYAATLIEQLKLDENGKNILAKILDTTLTDAFYTILLGLDGAANIGGAQHLYKLYDEDNNELTGIGNIEGYAWEYFHGDKN
nr:hypothetical protein [uncultured Mucilaginibacter sp.]